MNKERLLKVLKAPLVSEKSAVAGEMNQVVFNVASDATKPEIRRAVEMLFEVDVEDVEPMTSVTPMRLKRREDVVTDGGMQDRILANAPDAREGFFAVPKVVE